MPDKKRDGMACESLAVLVSSCLNGNTTCIIALVSKGMGGAIVEGVQDVCKMSVFYLFSLGGKFRSIFKYKVLTKVIRTPFAPEQNDIKGYG